MSNKTKKLLILNLPYFIAGLVCTNLGEAWRIAEGADMSEKLLCMSDCPETMSRLANRTLSRIRKCISKNTPDRKG